MNTRVDKPLAKYSFILMPLITLAFIAMFLSVANQMFTIARHDYDIWRTYLKVPAVILDDNYHLVVGRPTTFLMKGYENITVSYRVGGESYQKTETHTTYLGQSRKTGDTATTYVNPADNTEAYLQPNTKELVVYSLYVAGLLVTGLVCGALIFLTIKMLRRA